MSLADEGKLEKLKVVGLKYSEASEFYDELIEGDFVEMHPQAKKIANQIANEILEILNG